MTAVLTPPAPTAGTAAPARRRPRTARRGWDVARVRRIGLAVLVLQLAALLAWNVVRADRFALTWDFSIYYQAFWQIAHGHLDPFDTLNRFPFWASHGELLMWPLGLIGTVWPSPMALLSVQSLALVGAEAVAFSWLCDLAGDAGGRPDARHEGRNPTTRLACMLAAGGLVLLVADPWTYWTASWDFHLEPVGILFVLLVARQLHRDPRRRRTWIWVALALLCGDVVATYLAGVGLCATLAGRRSRRAGLLVTIAAVAWTVALAGLHANRASALAPGYGYLVVGAGAASPPQLGMLQLAEGIVRHPARVLRVVWERRLDLYASLGACGLVGVLSPWVVMAAVVVFGENMLYRYAGFSAPGFQTALVYVLVPVGTVHVVTVLARRRRRAAMALAALVTAAAVGWGAVWIPRTIGQWVRVSPRASAVLSSVARRVPGSAQVVASQGISGRFAGRRWIYAVSGPTTIPLHGSPVWVVVAPSQGIETAPVAVSDALVAELAGPLHAQLVAHRAGVWAFRWVPPPGTHQLVVPARAPTIGAWSAAGVAGTPALTGPEADWRAVANGRSAYVVAGDYWREPPGRYQATVTLSSTVRVNVEVWNATGDVLLARRTLPPTTATRAVTMDVDASHRYPVTAYGGTGPFVMKPLSPTPDNRLEIRVWTPGKGIVSVASLELVAHGH